MAFLFFFMVLALTTVQSVKSQERNFAQFGDDAGDDRFSNNVRGNPEDMRGVPRFFAWTLPKDIPDFNGNKARKILVSKYLRFNMGGLKELSFFFNPVWQLLLIIYPCRILKIYFFVQYEFLNKKLEYKKKFFY